MPSRKWRIAVLLVLPPLLGVGAVLYATRWGAGISSDSVDYITAARSLIGGHGLSQLDGSGEYRPMTQWPPLYPLVLSASGLVGADPLAGARAVGALLFGLNVLLVGLMVWRGSGGSLAASLFASLILLGSPVFVRIHAMAWSEPLFLAFAFSGLFALACHFARPAWSTLAVASAAVGAGLLTRYAGAGVVLAGVVGLLLFRPGALRRRLVDCLVFGAISCVPTALWLARNVGSAGTAASRVVRYREVTADHYLDGWTTLTQWLVPPSLPAAVQALLVAGLVLVAGVWIALVVRDRTRHAARDSQVAGPRWFPALLGIFIVVYVGSLIGTMTFFHPSCSLNYRFLAPAFVALLLGVACSVGRRMRLCPRPRGLGLLLAGAGLAFSASFLAAAVDLVKEARHGGLGFATPRWRKSQTIRSVRSLPPGCVIYANNAPVVYLYAGRPAYSVPLRFGPSDSPPDEEYLAELAVIEERLREGDGVLVAFNGALARYMPSTAELVEWLGLRPVFTGKDGGIYKLAEPARPQ